MEPKTTNVILVPSDFSEVAEYAIDHAICIAKALDLSICLFHVIDKNTKAMLKKENKGLEWINTKLQSVADEIKSKNNIEVSILAKEGTIFTTIAEVAKEVAARLVVMGTHGKIGVQHLVGSYAFKVIASLNIPIIVVQQKMANDGYKNILITLDSTQESKQKVKWAEFIAKIFHSTVHILTTKESDEILAHKVKGNLAQVKKMFDTNGIKYTETLAKTGSGFTKQVLNFLNTVNADLVLLLTTSDALPAPIVGTKEEHVLFNASKIPVMCINSRDFNIKIIGM
ncbi:MAG: universal stress protein [Bacteroidetes bacterium]|nr:universal stress protein [Bacteroidota bacterium]